MIQVQRSNIRLKPDPRRVLLHYLNFGDSNRHLPILEYLDELSEKDAKTQLASIKADFAERHFGRVSCRTIGFAVVIQIIIVLIIT